MAENNSKPTQNQLENYELKPCPFCGGSCTGAEISYEEKNFRIYCDECPAEMVLYFADAGLGGGEVIGFDEMQSVIQEMIDKWNTRTPKERGGVIGSS